ncbi:MAG: RNA polymerase sigma factor [Planctomycetes bacterium]|nr:RNA polymerase sigma factor [Planctomycetota bacterium]
MPTPSPVVSLRCEHELRARGVRLECSQGESEAERDGRIESALVELFREQGSKSAFDDLYEHSRASVLDWLRWRVRVAGSRLDPLALLQDTFVNVFLYAHSYRPGERGGFRAWVRTIAANVVRRAQSRFGARGLSMDAQGAPEFADRGLGPARGAADLEEAVELRSTWRLFLAHYLRAFSTLRDRDRRALELVELEGRSYAEAAAELGVGGSNMKMIMLRARQRLCAALRLSLGLQPPLQRVRASA